MAPSEPRDEWLSGLWYLAGLSRAYRPGTHERRMLFGEPVVLGRSEDGTLFALRDVCPHRGAPLSRGRQCRDHENGAPVPALACPYHGWRFSTLTGACVGVPALCPDLSPAVSPAVSPDQSDGKENERFRNITVPTFRLHEANGLIWIAYRAKGGGATDGGATDRGATDGGATDGGATDGGATDGGATEMAPPDIGLPPVMMPRTMTRVLADTSFDEAALGLVDAAHTPVVHKQWWWRDGAPRKEKLKIFEPTALGFRMPPHAPSSNSRIYKMLGGAPLTEIEFRLPALRLEHVTVGRHRVLGLTAMTPLEKGRIQITHVIFHDIPWLLPLKPVLQAMSDSFLAQDGAILSAQHENLSRLDHRPLYLGDPDVPAQWYFRLKKAWMESGQGGFENPVPAARLRWRT